MNDEQMSISQFSDLSVLHESHNVFLVQSRTTGKLAIILNEKSGKILYVQFLQATDRQLDYMDDFDRILSEAE